MTAELNKAPQAVVGAELPPLPQLLLDRISDYGMARTEGMTDVDRVHLWETLITDVKRYAANAIAADRAQQASAAAPSDLLNADEIAALRRFDECAQDGEGYDVPKAMMRRLSEIGVVQRRSGAYYQATDFGQRVLASPAQASAAPADGWKMVPIEPTDDMIVAFAEQWYSKVRCIDDCEMEDCYAAMLAASPEPATAAVPAECPMCDGHGCTHYPDGEWRGKCAVCKGTGIDQSAAPSAQPVEQPADDARDAERDPLYEKAVMVVRATQRASISMVQRHLMIGYNRASRLIEAMEKDGVVSAPDYNGHRTVRTKGATDGAVGGAE